MCKKAYYLAVYLQSIYTMLSVLVSCSALQVKCPDRCGQVVGRLLHLLSGVLLWAALEVHFCLIIRHQVLGYRLNTYRLEVTGYSDDPWWREFYIDFKFSRLQFGSCPIGPTGDGPSGADGDEPPPHGEHADHLPDPTEGWPPTPPQQPSTSSSTDNIHVVVNQNRCTPEPIPPLRYYISQHLNLLGANPTITSGSCPEEILARNETIHTELEVGGEQIQTPKNCEVPDELDDADLPPLPMAP